MEKGRDIAQLNLVLELVSDFASLTTLKELERTIDSRLRWILDFEHCELRMKHGGGTCDDSDLEYTLPGPFHTSIAISIEALVRQALETGVPASVGMPISSIVYPLGLNDKPLGVLCLSAGESGFSYRDLRLLHHICSSLGAVLTRIHQATIESEFRANEVRLQSMNVHLEQRVLERTSERDILIATLQATDMSIQVLDMDLRLQAINDAGTAKYKRVFGTDVVIGDRLPEVLKGAPAQTAAFLALWCRALGGEAFTVQQEFGESTSQSCSYEMRFEVLRGCDGMQTGAFMTAVDITDSARQQRALADTQEALRQSQKLEAIGHLTGGGSRFQQCACRDQGKYRAFTQDKLERRATSAVYRIDWKRRHTRRPANRPIARVRPQAGLTA